METWLEKKQCTGCGACSNICPKGAIKMIADDTGFMYPVIDQSLCINCGLCKKTCPIVDKFNPKRYDSPKVMASWSKDEDNRYISTSGGMFFELAKKVIENDGYVVGARYNKENLVEHYLTNDLKELESLRQSKYLQSDIKNIYNDTKKVLNNGKKVLFAGAPCQIAGLYKFLKKDYENLMTVEFICRGMNSPKAYKAWISEIEKNKKSKVIKVWFKYKTNGWKNSPRCTRLDFEDGTSQVYDGKENLYMSGYLGPNLYIRPSCGNCKFNGLSRQADITLADFWGIKKELDDDKGTSLVLTNSDKGNKLVEDIKEYIVFENRTIDEIYHGNVCFNNSVNINPKSEKFLKSLNDSNFSKQIKKYSTSPFYKKIIKKALFLMKK